MTRGYIKMSLPMWLNQCRRAPVLEAAKRLRTAMIHDKHDTVVLMQVPNACATCHSQCHSPNQKKWTGAAFVLW